MNGFAEGLQTDVISTDFAKAFDKLSHAHLLSLLRSLGVHGPFLRWMDSYLRGRQLVILVMDNLLKPIPATSGIPQGSHHGPLLSSDD